MSVENGYRLNVGEAYVDAHRFVDTVRAHHRELAPLASMLSTGPDPDWPSRQRLTELVESLESALATWRGTPYADLPDHPDVMVARAGLEEARARAEDDLVLAMLALGEHASTVTMTEQAVQRSSLRERSWSLHALALARSGRQAEALETLRELRRLLDDELGIDPTPEVRSLEEALLRQDAAVLEG
ncbi:AfsR/SARP family transcriptional regulator [Nocardioides KLBMP 9356]|uniref:AfsR/SARP family transcriptional regulator n=1 Tax=Nocardioides potassii TaxID=2911371 RepID=A0ABS9HDQ3_9ACTN|nr:AfsR/SARP family transcriptional regulator [Nocardioides potassii]MCF6378417.1 AfsR/SARP family transcriptional regulator [Nocardioides potassii]